MLTRRGGDGEGLLHESIRLVAITIRAVFALVLTVLSILLVAWVERCRETVSASLTFHLAISQEAARDTTCTPRLAVGPSPHPCLTLIPDEDRTRPD